MYVEGLAECTQIISGKNWRRQQSGQLFHFHPYPQHTEVFQRVGGSCPDLNPALTGLGWPDQGQTHLWCHHGNTTTTSGLGDGQC